MIKGGIEMAQYKFRVECQDHLDELEEALEKASVQYEIVTLQRSRPELPLVGDRVVTISATASLGRVREVMHQVPGGNLMVETVELEADYTGERKYGI